VTNRAWRVRYLLDIWAEPREVESLPVVLRARVRDLSNDEETYVGSIAELDEIVEARLDADGVTPRRWERP
jgi:hypothetical protein